MNRRQALLSLAALAASPVVPVDDPLTSWRNRLARSCGHMAWSGTPNANYVAAMEQIGEVELSGLGWVGGSLDKYLPANS